MSRPLSPRLRWLPTLCLAWALVACASAPRAREPVKEPALHWAEVVRQRIADSKDLPAYPVRYNPTVCDCPPFEIELAGHWLRLTFVNAEPDDPTRLALDAAVAAARARGVVEVWQVQGSLQEGLSTCGRGSIVVGLEASAFGAPPPREPPAGG